MTAILEKERKDEDMLTEMYAPTMPLPTPSWGMVKGVQLQLPVGKAAINLCVFKLCNR